MNFIGIDLSWKVSPVKALRTAAVVLNEKCVVIANALLSTDEDIVEFIKTYINKGCIVGIDAPLVVPPIQKQRKCERMLLECGIGVFPGKREWFYKAFGGVRGEILVKKLKSLGIPLRDSLKPQEQKNALFEVYPYSAWKVLFKKEKVPKYKNTTRKRKVEGLSKLRRKLLDSSLSPRIKLERKLEYPLDVNISNLSSKAMDQLGDLLDALMAAYTVLIFWHYKERCVILGDLKEGFILTLANDCLREIAKKRKY